MNRASVRTLAACALAIALLSACHPKPPPLSEDAAVDGLIDYIERAHRYAAWTPMECLRFYVEGTTAEHVDVAVREKHEGKCPGDPRVEPIVDRYRIARDGGDIALYDAVAGGVYRPLSGANARASAKP